MTKPVRLLIPMKKRQGYLILVVVSFAAMFWAADLKEYLTFAYLKAVHVDISTFAENQFWLSSCIYVAGYIFIAAFSLPGATIMTLAGGAVFGTFFGVGLASFASSIGATLAMLISRFVLQSWVQSKFSEQLELVNTGLDKQGKAYLFGLRVVPLFPFFIINLVMGITRIPTWTFFWISLLGMFPGTFIYVYAGEQLASLSSLSGVFSFRIIIALSLLGIFPLLAQRLLVWLNKTSLFGKSDI